MSQIKARDNKSTELRMAAILRGHRISGWRRQLPLPGPPDFVFRKERLCVFVDGCFWHACPRCYKAPRSNGAFWHHKAVRNRARDRKVNRELRDKGWHVVRLWEHSLRAPERVAARLRRALGRP